MKIAIINNIYPPFDRGGAEQVVVKTVEGLRAAGHEVVVITSSPEGEHLEHRDGITIYRTRPRNLFFYTNAHHHAWPVRFLWHVLDIFNYRTARWVQTILKRERPDVVHTHNLMGLSFQIPRIIRELGFRHVHHVHDVQLVEPSAMILKQKATSWRYNGWPTRVYTAIMRALMGSPEVVVSPSQFLKDFYTRRGFFRRSNFTIIRNPATFSVQASAFEEPLGERFTFLYLGQIESHKGVMLLVDAFNALTQDSAADCILHIVGDGSLLEAVKAATAANQKVVVHGRKDREQIKQLFEEVDITVVPSLCYENSPTVIFESFAFGVPVLASNSEGIAELIEEGENGITFAVGNVDSLRERLQWCLTHRPEIGQMSKKTPQLVQGFSVEAYVRRLVELYEDRIR